MTITRVGTNQAYADGWAKAFGSGKTARKKTTAKASSKGTRKKAAKRKKK